MAVSGGNSGAQPRAMGGMQARVPVGGARSPARGVARPGQAARPTGIKKPVGSVQKPIAKPKPQPFAHMQGPPMKAPVHKQV